MGGHLIDSQETAGVMRRVMVVVMISGEPGPLRARAWVGLAERALAANSRKPDAPQSFPQLHPRIFKKISYVHRKVMRLRDSSALPYRSQNLNLCREER